MTASTTVGNTLWALTDHLGSVRDLVDNNGVIREHNVYDSFGRLVREVDYNAAGQVIASTDPAAVDTLFGYTGRLFDSHTGLQYNRARWYDASTGRWLSQDPIGFAAGDANLYRYTGNNSVSRVDPDGLDWWETNDPEDLYGERDYNSMGGWNPWGWDIFFGAKTGLFYVTGGWSAANRSIELERQHRKVIRLRSQSADWDVNVQTVISSYKASQCEVDAATGYAEVAVNYNASALGGAFITPAGANAWNSFLQANKGQYRNIFEAALMYRFKGIAGETYEEVIKRIPSTASKRTLTPVVGKVTQCVEYKWVDNGGVTIRVRIHGPDPSAPVGSNANSGWVVRVERGSRVLDSSGKWRHKNCHNPNSPYSDPAAANSTHIPIQLPVIP